MRFITNTDWYLYFYQQRKKKHFIGKVAPFNLCQLLLKEHVPSNQNLTNELKSGAQDHWLNGSNCCLFLMWSKLTLVITVQVYLFVVVVIVCWFFLNFSAKNILITSIVRLKRNSKAAPKEGLFYIQVKYICHGVSHSGWQVIRCINRKFQSLLQWSCVITLSRDMTWVRN